MFIHPIYDMFIKTHLQVTPAEMGALVSVFDVDGDGVITCEEFTKVFLNMGFKERERY
jgi:Ca2+-binding EF-hand superfamily protein